MFGLLKALFTPPQKRSKLKPSESQLEFARDLGIRRMKREAKQAAVDASKFGPELVTKRDKWEKNEGSTFLAVFMKNGIKKG